MGLKLEYINGNGESTNSLEKINQILAPVFVKIYLIDLSAISKSQQLLLSKITLDDTEKVELLSSFILNREQIIEKIKDSGREPNVAGGGFLETRAVDLRFRNFKKMILAAMFRRMLNSGQYCCGHYRI
ncbi:hypothetical protein PsalMR5_04071 [Piscirickettsia salmonis]|uniref:hypothetical protein n=1 Tax=Piscirickettsia salmonis TaxID=1238 RepID=UPI0012BAA088|nr:hypothetical protein [Piscirickettsia salmonis]QGP56580.1 hypothetical protein PsalSR1_04069 [Piscirickettsia salmonis]QGP61388.1 hypothetical protein PsalBI1_04030 [Piscirickettsia salmonis]QGP66146.1 hypothetical protein PsalMR5_04071 [Piscirickettsia salmonis]